MPQLCTCKTFTLTPTIFTAWVLIKLQILRFGFDARQEGFLIVTKDADFSKLCLLQGFPPKIIWIRRGNCKTGDIEAILRSHYDDIENLNNDETVGVLRLF